MSSPTTSPQVAASPSYKLTYFNFRGRGELIRWILATSGVRWENCTVPIADWPRVKTTFPNHQLPILTLPNGTVLTQSLSIARFLASQFGLHPSDNFEAFRCDEIADTLYVDLANAILMLHPRLPAEQRQKGVENWMNSAGPKYFAIISDWVRSGHNGFLVGGKLTWADLAVGSVIDNVEQIPEIYDSLKPFPVLVEFTNKLKQGGKLRDYLKTRPAKADFQF